MLGRAYTKVGCGSTVGSTYTKVAATVAWETHEMFFKVLQVVLEEEENECGSGVSIPAASDISFSFGFLYI